MKQITNLVYVFFICAMLSPLLCFSQHGLLAEYYNGTDFETFVSKKYVNNIEEFWNETAPVNGIDPHYCSIRWTGKLVTSKTAIYIFSAIVDDGIRVWIDGELVINQWDLNDFGVFKGKKVLEAYKEYDLKVEYFNALNEAEVQLMWDIEKASEDQSWGEYFFGVEYNYKTIPMANFLRPIEKIEVEEIVEKIEPPVIKKEKPIVVSKPKVKEKTPPPIVEKEAPPIVQKEVMTIEKAQKFIPKDVQFAQAKSDVLPTSFEALDVFARFMKDNPLVTVVIEGHTDVVGDKAKNQELSENRAKKISSYLVDKGISSSRIMTVGYGGSKPLKEPVEGEYYPPNRRVVFKLSGI